MLRKTILSVLFSATAFAVTSPQRDALDDRLAYSLNFQISPRDASDCSNGTHRWNSLKGNCLDDSSTLALYRPQLKPHDGANDISIFGRYLANLGLHPRQALCGPDEILCWGINCCSPGETCGSISDGCQVSWSTIYTTTTTTSLATITSWVYPNTSGVSYTTVTVNTTAYATSFNQITLTGEGLDDVIEANFDVQTTLVLSAYTPPAVTTTHTITLTSPVQPQAVAQQQQQPRTTTPPALQVRQERETGRPLLLPRVDIPKRSAGTSYTTLTVYLTSFFTTSTIATASNAPLVQTVTSTVSSVATKNQTHYETPTGFLTSTIMLTSMTTSYAYGTAATPTRAYYVTVTATATPRFTETGGLAAPTIAIVPAGEGDSGSESSSRRRQLSPGAVAGIVLGVALAFVIAAAGVFFLRRRHMFVEADEKDSSMNALPPPVPSLLPSPKPPIGEILQPPPARRKSTELPDSPMSYLFFSGLNDDLATIAAARNPNPKSNAIQSYGQNYKNQSGGRGGHNNTPLVSSSRHSRKGSRNSSMTSISPVPEEAENEAEIFDPENWNGETASQRGSAEHGNWGRGYGGRGGYYNVANRAASGGERPTGAGWGR
ncbi:hypothetical protein Dda_9330 [Drechslerella dactyloides]|uniref:Mid2 domain-containing protein n=1 Tax=Drechslerella dactyloides TaxID=74499 RepID=A0AAD6IRT7_DREDA|nr:hypothetical protein Dda_9330 [Drechslerella dactyloides]